MELQQPSPYRYWNVFDQLLISEGQTFKQRKSCFDRIYLIGRTIPFFFHKRESYGFESSVSTTQVTRSVLLLM
jgi:hypothetical protein